MITVLSLKEFEVLLRDKHISSSENIEFITNKELRNIIMLNIAEATGKQITGGFIAVLCGVDNDIDESILELHSNEIMLRLPRPRNPVYLSLPDNLSGIRIDSQVLTTLVQLNLNDSQMNSLAKEMFQLNTRYGSDYDYAFLYYISLSDVKQVIYSPELEDKISNLKKFAQYNDLIFTPTNLFSK